MAFPFLLLPGGCIHGEGRGVVQIQNYEYVAEARWVHPPMLLAPGGGRGDCLVLRTRHVEGVVKGLFGRAWAGPLAHACFGRAEANRGAFAGPRGPSVGHNAYALQLHVITDGTF